MCPSENDFDVEGAQGIWGTDMTMAIHGLARFLKVLVSPVQRPGPYSGRKGTRSRDV